MTEKRKNLAPGRRPARVRESGLRGPSPALGWFPNRPPPRRAPEVPADSRDWRDWRGGRAGGLRWLAPTPRPAREVASWDPTRSFVVGARLRGIFCGVPIDPEA